VVCSDIDGYRDVMTDETGVLVAPGDPKALAGAVAGLLDDEARRERLGVSSRRVAQERYSWDDIARRLEAIYRELA
jgi:D-inositol-3-phosphate glycosyltransferase